LQQKTSLSSLEQVIGTRITEKQWFGDWDYGPTYLQQDVWEPNTKQGRYPEGMRIF